MILIYEIDFLLINCINTEIVQGDHITNFHKVWIVTLELLSQTFLGEDACSVEWFPPVAFIGLVGALFRYQ